MLMKLCASCWISPGLVLQNQLDAVRAINKGSKSLDMHIIDLAHVRELHVVEDRGDVLLPVAAIQYSNRVPR
jgi:hypothetical protein